MRARHYDPHLRQWTAPDPLGYVDGFDVWGYVGGDPLNFTDPFGAKSTCYGGKCDPPADDGWESRKAAITRKLDSKYPPEERASGDITSAAAALSGAGSATELDDALASYPKVFTEELLALASSPGLIIALGLNRSGIDEFVLARGAKVHADLYTAPKDEDELREQLEEMMNTADEIHFQLNGLSRPLTHKPPNVIKASVSSSALHSILQEVYASGEPKTGTWTNWEFRSIMDSPALFNKTTFWTGTKQVSIDRSQFAAD